ncbi:odorant receptor 33b-like [Hermetia illucens]|uniref:odorant receptor 33b-like n=1 Tax=Hermetia illucens TaxID=343691 RepID=UPI0018CC24D8|nr:odorant receptor 33b-like [Hermetia illucens]
MEVQIIRSKVNTERFLNGIWQKAFVTFVLVVPNIVTILSFLTQLFYIRDIKEFSDNFPMNITVVTCLLKFSVILKMRLKLIGINDHFAKLDSMGLTERQVEKLEGLILFCNRLTSVVAIFYSLVSASTALNAALSNGKILMFNVWTPYDFRQSMCIYWTTLLFQYSCFCVLSLQNLTNDLTAPLYFIILRAHLEILIERIQNVGWDPTKTQEENYEDFIGCIEDHRIIMEIYKTLQNAISSTIFIQFASTAVAVAMEILVILFFVINFTQLMMLFISTVAAAAQILFCCYYVNNFTVVTNELVTAIYFSNIFDQSMQFRKTAIIFMQMTQKPKVVLAGKMFPVTLVTFASIMRTSYSILTVANQLR